MNDFPSQARVVIIGGGIMGCSTAYHLGKLGWTDVVLLERHELTSGSTFHAAGLVGQLRTSANITQLLGYSVQLYDTLEQETGLATGWKMNGGLRLACNEARWIEVKRQATTARSFGLEMQLLTPKQAQELWPLMDVSDVIGAAFLPTDGQVNPSDITQSLAKGARMKGVRIFAGADVTGIEVTDGKIVAVLTSQGRIDCAVVVNCAGQWAREVGRMAGVNVPLVSIEHQYVVTEPIPGVARNLPTLRDPDRLTYYKEEVGGLIMGGYEPNPVPWAVGGFPKDFNYKTLPPDFDHFEQLMDLALARVPALETAGVKELINGPECFTPDGNFILGEAPELKNFFVGAGFNAFGIAAAGGAGMVLAEWVVKGEPPFDMWPVDIRRFGRPHFDESWIRKRTLEMYGKHYTIAWPNEEHESGRPCRRSPLYERLQHQGACFGEKLGWERPNWFAGPGEEAKDRNTFHRPNWFAAVGREHQATRERVAVFDQTSFAKFVMVGRDAEAALQWICANDVARPVGTLVYTQMLNARGGIKCDLTVGRLARDRYYIVTGTGFATHDFAWIARHIPEGLDASLVDMTSGYAVLSLMGPRARDVLARITGDDLSNEGFRFGTVREIGVAGAPVLALRVTYVGELGWELHIPTEFAVNVYEAVMAAGADVGIANAGYRAIESLRLEKGYRAWGKDITSDTNPFEAGLGFAVRMEKAGGFLGRDALVEVRARGIERRLCCLTLDDSQAVVLGNEPVRVGGDIAGRVTSGGYGYTVERSIAYAYLPEARSVPGTVVEVDIVGRWVAGQVMREPLYDPRGDRVRAS